MPRALPLLALALLDCTPIHDALFPSVGPLSTVRVYVAPGTPPIDDALAEWTRATGVRFAHVSTPRHAKLRVRVGDCGADSIACSPPWEIWLDPQITHTQLLPVLLHELGHNFGAGTGHTTTGIMRPAPTARCVDAGTVERVCSAGIIACSRREPCDEEEREP